MFALISYPVLFEPAFNTHSNPHVELELRHFCRPLRVYGLQVESGGAVGVPLGPPANPCPIKTWQAGYLWVRGAQPLQEAGADPAPSAAAVFPPTAKTYWMWLLLPAVASVLLLAITNHLSQNVAAIPFLWVLPSASTCSPHPLLRRRRLVPAQPLPATPRRRPGQHGLRRQRRSDQ